MTIVYGALQLSINTLKHALYQARREAAPDVTITWKQGIGDIMSRMEEFCLETSNLIVFVCLPRCVKNCNMDKPYVLILYSVITNHHRPDVEACQSSHNKNIYSPCEVGLMRIAIVEENLQKHPYASPLRQNEGGDF